MFNLDRSIAEWRRQMLVAGIKTPVPLDELESHLRDDVEQRMCSGSSAPEAFAAAIERVGQSAALKNEFEKIGGTKEARRRNYLLRSFFLGAGLFVAGVSLCYLNSASMTTNYLFLVLSAYGVITTAGVLTYWLTRRWQTSKPQFIVVAAAVLVTGVAWEAFSMALNLLNIGQVSLHAYGWGGIGHYLLLPLIRAGFTAALALPAALAISVILRRSRLTNRDHTT